MTGVLYVIDQLGLSLQAAQQQLEQQAQRIAQLEAALAEKAKPKEPTP